MQRKLTLMLAVAALAATLTSCNKLQSRDHLNKQWDRADTLDPASPASDTRAAVHNEP